MADFWGRVDCGHPEECWDWMASVDTHGYGHLHKDGKIRRAHRIAYELACGPIPAGEGHHGVVVMHTCDNRRCCNPSHLRLGTQAQNNADKAAKGRQHRPRGERNGRAKITAGMAAEIRSAPQSLNTLARHYGLSRGAVRHIKIGKAWAV